MKRMRLGLSILCLLYITGGHAIAPQRNGPSNPSHGPLSIEALTNYSDYSFNSKTGNNFNQFRGHSNLYLIGGQEAKFRENLTTGILFYNITSRVTSEVLLAPTALITTHQRVNNNNIMVHALQQIKPNWYIDLLGNYGQSQLSYQTAIAAEAETPALSSPANSHGHNWYVSITGEHVYPWRQITLRSFISLLHSETYQAAYNYHFTPLTTDYVAPISNHATFLLENAELQYKASSNVHPFVNAGLLQVLQYNNSRPIVSSIALLGSLPEFNINQNGFRVGGGVSILYKQVILRIEQQYDQRGTVYHSNQTIAALIFVMD